jgi:hypothetical protein
VPRAIPTLPVTLGWTLWIASDSQKVKERFSVIQAMDDGFTTYRGLLPFGLTSSQDTMEMA